MRNRTWSDVVMAAMIALCFATVAKQQAQPPAAAKLDATRSTEVAPKLSDAAQSLAVAVLLSGESTSSPLQSDSSERAPVSATASAANRAMTNAAQAAGNVARDIEMPFFSFGGDASAE